jgi:hypothetical protein
MHVVTVIFLQAKFANNVDFGTGALGTNVVWMYKDLSAKVTHTHTHTRKSILNILHSGT